jgi:predicted enzyme related to lactoylglutathione lyase
MKIKLSSVFVDDQAKALEFYTKVLGVVFRVEPTQMRPAAVAMFEDTCGNLIQLYQV